MSPARSRHALVLGGTGYVGQGVLRQLAARGVRATFTYRRKESEARELCSMFGHRARPIDLRVPAEIRALCAELQTEARSPDVLIHCATLARPLALSAVTDEIREDAYAVNVRSAFIACQALFPAWVERGGGGDVVLLTYVDGAHPTPMPAYVALTQTAVVGLAQALAKEYGAHGVRINAVQIGPLQDGVARELPVSLFNTFERLSAIGRAGTADEVARAIAFVALENTYMTGQVFPVQGGL